MGPKKWMACLLGALLLVAMPTRLAYADGQAAIGIPAPEMPMAVPEEIPEDDTSHPQDPGFAPGEDGLPDGMEDAGPEGQDPPEQPAEEDDTANIPRETDNEGQPSEEGERIPKSYPVAFLGSGASDVSEAAETAIHGQDYTFALVEEEGYIYTVVAAIGGIELGELAAENSTWVLPGGEITGGVTITVAKTPADLEEFEIVFTGSGAEDAKGAATASQGTDYHFVLHRQPGYLYTVEAACEDQPISLSAEENGLYCIPGDSLTGPVSIHITKTQIEVLVAPYLSLDGSALFLLQVAGDVPEGQSLAYGQETMYWSDVYGAFVWLVYGGDLPLDEAWAQLSLADGDAQPVEYDGDLNDSGSVDINDAQLVYDMYNAGYVGFDDLPMLAFLRADVDGDGVLGLNDALLVAAGLGG